MSYYTRLITFVSGGKLPASDLNAEFDTIKTSFDAIEADVDAAALAVTTAGSNTTSTTSNNIGVGSKTWTVQTGKSLVVGMTYKMARTSAPTNWMVGTITTYDSTTGSLTISIDRTNGSGTGVTDWTGSLSGYITTATTGYRAITYSDTVVASDAAGMIDVTSGTITLALTAASTLGAFFCYVRNSGTGVVTLDPAGSDLIDSAATGLLSSGATMLIHCDGVSAFRTAILGVGGGATSSGDYTFTQPGAGYLLATPTSHGYTATMPDARYVPVGSVRKIKNDSTYDYMVRDSAGTLLGFVPPGFEASITSGSNATAAGSWSLSGGWHPAGVTASASSSLSLGGGVANVIRAEELDTNRTFLLIGLSGGGIYGCVYDKSTKTFGTATSIRSGITSHQDNQKVLKIATDTLLVVSGYSSSYVFNAVVVTTSGTSISAVGTAATLALQTDAIAQPVASGSSYFISFVDSNSGSPITKAVACTVSGTTVTLGSAVSCVYAVTGSSVVSYLMSAGQFLVVGQNTSSGALTCPVSVSGSTCTAGSAALCSNAASFMSCCQLSNGYVVVTGIDTTPTNRYAYLASVASNAVTLTNVNLGAYGQSNYALLVPSGTKATIAFAGKANVVDGATTTISQGTAVTLNGNAVYMTGYTTSGDIYFSTGFTSGGKVSINGSNPSLAIFPTNTATGNAGTQPPFFRSVAYDFLRGSLYSTQLATVVGSAGYAYRNGAVISTAPAAHIPIGIDAYSHNQTSYVWSVYGSTTGVNYVYRMECA